MTSFTTLPQPGPPVPATNAQVIDAINGYRRHLDEVHLSMILQLEKLAEQMQARLDPVYRTGRP